ncbi:UDP-N-acetylglucosamine 2-epimerase (non-hydrolyzing) [bacterium]|nr:UDP-N-acetylglucosamine 2-epimerase (non-hydrolyzing) [bacterium]NIN91896.1 UDP-N-acetylglucosamine 2-epimerase (non-hydrolyzing) [bacterium]NIO18162.1 UDP-N-acetylglucosamine 2-epimerase (non-hydrolyzing) [bacterium]NIO73137.1 UDP-N-acetylglucosamine 2-epimerase (non-hydrolyzing) [bacterium]
MKKIICIFGTRPEAIKMAPVLRELKKKDDLFKAVVVVTAQHREMLDQVLRLFNLRSHYDLNIMQESQTPYHITTSALSRLEKVINIENPDFVLVQGDTTTTFAAALASFYQRVPVGHIEAGLRSYDRFNPYPEEVNRLLTDALCDLHFAPTPTAKRSLLKENIKKESIFVTGNTVIDALYLALKKAHRFRNSVLKKIDFNKKRIILLTAHRRENWGTPLENICLSIKKLIDKYDDLEIIFPVHLNPKIRNVVYKLLKKSPRIHLIKPLDYLDFVNLLNKCSLVLTDSGGLQEEAPALGKPVLLLREVTERPEAVKAGTVKVVGLSRNRIFEETCKLLNSKRIYERMATSVNPYGDGKTSARIVEAILYYFEIVRRRPKDFTPLAS